MSLVSTVGVGISDDSFTCGSYACQTAIEKLGSRPDVVIVFASSVLDQQKMIEGVRSISKDILLVGCSSAGEITKDGPVDARSVVVMALKSDTVHFYGAAEPSIAGDPRESGRKVAKELRKLTGETLKACLTFPDSITANGSDAIRGIFDILGLDFPIAGGSPGDDFKFEKTYQYLNDKVYSGGFVALGLAGEVSIGIGARHGWVPVGVPRIATKTNGAVLLELDERPALSIYDDYFGEESRDLQKGTLDRLGVTYPLGVKDPASDEVSVVDPVRVDPAGAITCAGEILQGAEVQLMIGSKDDAITAAWQAAKDALRALGGKKPAAALIFDSAARKKLFAENGADETNAIMNIIGNEVPTAGFYSFAEQSSLAETVKTVSKFNPAFSNETVVVCLIGE